MMSGTGSQRHVSLAGSSAGVTAQYPMQLTAAIPTIQPGVNIYKDPTDNVALISSPPKTTQSVEIGGARVTETHLSLTPTISAPVVVSTNSWSEDLQPTVSTRTYETVRRDINSIFPNSTIVGVGQPTGQIVTGLGTVFDPRTGSVNSNATNFSGLLSGAQQPMSTSSVVFAEPVPSKALIQPRRYSQPIYPGAGTAAATYQGATFGGSVPSVAPVVSGPTFAYAGGATGMGSYPGTPSSTSAQRYNYPIAAGSRTPIARYQPNFSTQNVYSGTFRN